MCVCDAMFLFPGQISRLNANVSELQTLLRHKDDSSRSYRERTDAQVRDLRCYTSKAESFVSVRVVTACVCVWLR